MKKQKTVTTRVKLHKPPHYSVSGTAMAMLKYRNLNLPLSLVIQLNTPTAP
jgi:hypothetical protein